MPKMKTNSSAKKRFKVSGSGHIKRKHAFKSSLSDYHRSCTEKIDGRQHNISKTKVNSQEKKIEVDKKYRKRKGARSAALTPFMAGGGTRT